MPFAQHFLRLRAAQHVDDVVHAKIFGLRAVDAGKKLLRGLSQVGKFNVCMPCSCRIVHSWFRGNLRRK